MEGSAPAVSLKYALDDYETTYMAFRNLADRTRVEYRRDLDDLVRFLNTSSALSEPQAVELKHLEQYLAELDRRGLRGSSRRRKSASIRSFFSFLESHRYTVHNVALKLRAPERETSEPRVLTEEEYRRLQDAVRFHARDQAIIELLLQTGMRLSELAALTTADADLPAKVGRDKEAAGSVRLLGKGRKQRTVTLNWKACKALKAYVSTRPESSGPSLFLSKFGFPLGRRAIQDIVSKYLKDAGIEGASVHTLRHTFGTHQVRKGTNLRVVQEAMGHTDLKTTSRYIHLARELMDEQLQANAL